MRVSAATAEPAAYTRMSSGPSRPVRSASGQRWPKATRLSTPAAKAEEVEAEEAAVESEEAAEAAAEAEVEGEGTGEEVGEEGENGSHRRRRAAGRGSSIRRSPCRTPSPATAATPRRVRMYLRRLRAAG